MINRLLKLLLFVEKRIILSAYKMVLFDKRWEKERSDWIELYKMTLALK